MELMTMLPGALFVFGALVLIARWFVVEPAVRSTENEPLRQVWRRCQIHFAWTTNTVWGLSFLSLLGTALIGSLVVSSMSWLLLVGLLIGVVLVVPAMWHTLHGVATLIEALVLSLTVLLERHVIRHS
jgi:hypothetical protein